MQLLIIRPPLIYGPRVKANFADLMGVVKSAWPLPLGNWHNQRSLVALDNLVDFILTCVRHPAAANQVFLTSDGQDLSTTELVHMMALAAGIPPRSWSLPPWALQVDISKARDLFGWMPPLSVNNGMKRAIEVIPAISNSFK